MTAWYIPIVLYIVLIHTFYPWFRKKYLIGATEINFTTKFTLHYFFAVLYAWIIILLFGEIQLDRVTFIIFCVGAANGFAAYCQWRADQISMSLGALFGFMDDVIAIGLGFIVLNETQYLSSGISVGLALCASATALLGINNYFKKKQGGKHVAPILFLYILGYTCIWGIATFLMRYWAVSNVPITKFVAAWYGGAFSMALIIFVVNKFWFKNKDAGEENKKTPSTKKTLALTSTAGAFIVGAIFLSYWAYQLAPLTVAKPILFASGLVPPMLVGMFLFNEKSQYQGIEKVFLIQAIVGALFVAFSFSG